MDAIKMFFYYTNEEGEALIRETGTIPPAEEGDDLYPALGVGIYLTDMPPPEDQTGKEFLARCLFNGQWHESLQAGMLDHYVMLTIPKQNTKLVHKTRRLFLFPGHESLQIDEDNSQICCDLRRAFDAVLESSSDEDMASESDDSDYCNAFDTTDEDEEA